MSRGCDLATYFSLVRKLSLIKSCAFIFFYVSIKAKINFDDFKLLKHSFLLFVMYFATAHTLFAPEKAVARILSQREVLERCYIQITGSPLKSNDPLIEQLKTGSAAKICSDLLNSVTLDSNSGLLSQPNNIVHRKILRQFYDFHRNWFDRKFQNTVEWVDQDWGTSDVYDVTMPALAVTKNLFSTSQHYSSILKGAKGAEALRDSTLASASGSPSNFKRPSRAFRSSDDGDGTFNINSGSVAYVRDDSAAILNPIVDIPFVAVPWTLVQVGELIGIRDDMRSNAVPHMVTKFVSPVAAIDEATLNLPHNLGAHYGGGILGSQAFLLYNFGHGLEYSTNGTLKLPRRWVANAFKSLLCSQTPYVRSSDVQPYIRTGDGVPPFRSNVSCLRCHVSQDQAALTARNLAPGITGVNFSVHPARVSASIVSYKNSGGYRATPEPGQEMWPFKAVGNFKNQAPNGAFVYRSLSGALHNKELQSIDDLGHAMTETEDFYACAAQHYVSQLMGVKVPFFDVGDPDNSTILQSLTDTDRKWRDFVLNLGKELRVTGSLKLLIQRILESEFYQQSEFGK